MRVVSTTLRFSTAVPLLLLLLAACGGGERSTKEPRGAWRDGQEWRLEEETRVGVEEGDGPDVFGNVVDVEIDPAGRVWIADAQQHQIRVFGRGGRHVRSIGRKGAGPEEFGGISGMAFAPDGKLWVLDGGNARFAVYDTAGTLLATHPRSSVMTTTPWPGGFDQQGRLYDVMGRVERNGSVSPLVVRFDAAVQPRDTFALPAFQEEVFEITRGDMRNRTVSQVNVPFTGSQRWGLDPQGFVWVANTAHYRIERHRFSGGVERAAERRQTLVPVTRQERDRMLESYQEFIRQGGRVDLSRIPDHHPALTRFLFDDAGHLWVSPITPESEGRVLDVFELSGRYLGRVAYPAPRRSAPYTIRGGQMAVVARDSLDVQTVIVMRVVKPEP